jgi:hypothetical protein
MLIMVDDLKKKAKKEDLDDSQEDESAQTKIIREISDFES